MAFSPSEMAIHVNNFVVGKVITTYEVKVCRYTIFTPVCDGGDS